MHENMTFYLWSDTITNQFVKYRQKNLAHAIFNRIVLDEYNNTNC